MAPLIGSIDKLARLRLSMLCHSWSVMDDRSRDSQVVAKLDVPPQVPSAVFLRLHAGIGRVFEPFDASREHQLPRELPATTKQVHARLCRVEIGRQQQRQETLANTALAALDERFCQLVP